LCNSRIQGHYGGTGRIRKRKKKKKKKKRRQGEATGRALPNHD
jgi:hypothetical protein